MNVGNLDKLAKILVLAPDRGEGGEILVKGKTWVEAEKMYLGRVESKGKINPAASREASEIEVVFEGWFRPVAQPQRRVEVDGVIYTIEWVEPRDGRQWMFLHVKLVK